MFHIKNDTLNIYRQSAPGSGQYLHPYYSGKSSEKKKGINLVCE